MTAMAQIGTAAVPGDGVTRDEKFVIFASSLGSVFEFYDFYLYAVLAPFFASLFFPAGNDTAALLPYGESEFGKFGIDSMASSNVRPPRVAQAPVAFECVLHQIVNIGTGPLAANVVFGRILLAHVRDEVIGADGFPDAGKLDLVGRLGREDYATTRDRFFLKRPDR